MSTARIRLGILGTGAVSQVAHLPLLAGRDDVEIAAVSDLDGLKAREVASRFGIERILDDRALIEDPGLDAIVIATPNVRHEEQALAAIATAMSRKRLPSPGRAAERPPTTPRPRRLVLLTLSPVTTSTFRTPAISTAP